MHIPVDQAVRTIDAQGLIRRRKRDESEAIISHVRDLLGVPLPNDLECFYRESIERVGPFLAVSPRLNGRMGWDADQDETICQLSGAAAVPVMFDGVGNLYALDLDPAAQVPGVYLYDHEREFALEHIAGTSLGSFLLILGDIDRALADDWPDGWQLRIDPDLDKSPKAPPEWKIRLW